MTRPLFTIALVLSAHLMLSACGTKPEAELEKARAAYQNKDYKSAVLHFKNVLQQSDSNAAVRLEYAQLLQATGDFAGVEQQLRRALELGADSNQMVPRIASWMLDRNEVKTLLRDFQSTELKDVAAQNRLRGLRAIAMLGSNRIGDAEKELLTITQPDAASALARAQVLAAKGDGNALRVVYRDARALAEKSTLGSEEWWVWRGLARLSLALGQGETALEEFKHANQLMPSHFGVLGEYGEALVGLNQIEEAKKIYAELLQKAPKYYRTALLESLLNLNAGQIERSYDAALRVLATVPDNVTCALIAARVELQRNSLATAESRLAAVLRANPNVVEALRMQSSISAKRGDFAQAEKLLQTAMQRSPNNIALKLEAAELALAKGNLKEAKGLAEETVTKNPNSAKAFGILASVAVQAKDKVATGKFMDLAVAALPAEPSSAESLFRLAIRSRSFKQAQSIIQLVQKLDETDPTPVLWQAVLSKEQGQDADAKSNLLASLEKKKDYIPALGLLKALQNQPGYVGEYGPRIKAAAQSSPKNESVVLDYLAWLKLKESSGPDLLAESLSALKAAPESAALRQFAAEQYLSLGKSVEADKLIAEGRSRFERVQAVQELAAQWAERQGKFDQAAQLYEKLVQAYPQSIAYAIKYAQALSQNRQLPEAIKAFERAVKLRPEDEAANRLLASARLTAGKKEDAFRGLDEFTKLPGRLVEGLLLKAGAHIALKEFGSARSTVDDALKRGAGERGLGALVALLDAESKPTESDAAIAQWLAKNPQSPSVLMLAASRAARQENYAKALPLYTRLLQLRPGNAFLLNELAWAQASLNLPEAVSNARAAMVLEPEDPNVMDTLAFALSRFKDSKKKLDKDTIVTSKLSPQDEAAELWQKVLTLRPGVAEPSLNYSALLIELGNKEKAREVLGQVDKKKLNAVQNERLIQLSAKAG